MNLIKWKCFKNFNILARYRNYNDYINNKRYLVFILKTFAYEFRFNKLGK